jgi:4-azaleucine resistance transporter AzlC
LNATAEITPIAPKERRALIRRAFIDSLPVLMGYSTMGFVAGVLLAAKGDVLLSPLWGLLSSACWVTGTMSIAGVGPISERASVYAFALITLAGNFRYAFYGISMLSRWKSVPFPKKLFLIHMLTDENYALETAARIPEPDRYERYCTCLSLLNLSYWVAGVTTGCTVVYALEKALSPERIKDAAQGVEFAMVALFLVILTNQIREAVRRGH